MTTHTDDSTATTPAGVARESAPKTTRPEAPSRRDDAENESVEIPLSRTFDAFPDRFDAGDWPYRPTLRALPDQLVNIGAVPVVLDQGREGACTGFALAAVINYLQAQRGCATRVSPRMLYEMARRYDEWPGEEYEGSSARGAMKGWQRHGVCDRERWPDELHGPGHLSDELGILSRKVPGGAYYRVDFRQVRHLHAALNEAGIAFATLMVHEGWGLEGDEPTVDVDVDGATAMALPVIMRKGRADAGHAVAIVGYTARGFIIQNSWGRGWGNGGYALLPYEDFMMHATDVWVAQLGVPVTADLWERGAADVLSGRHRAGEVIPLGDIRPYVINIGNNGLLSKSGDYWTSEEDVARLFTETIPRQTAGWRKRRVMLFLHGGLNDEKAVAKRVVAFRDVCLQNEIYPLHIMWESDWFRSTVGMLEDLFTSQDQRAGWSFKDWVREARDRMFELTLAKPGGALWQEMKENARLASEGAQGAMRIVANAVRQATAALPPAGLQAWELHVVGHSAGSIFAASAAPLLMEAGVPWKTTQLLAPAITVADYRSLFEPAVGERCPLPQLYVLSDVGELDDDVGPYGKSLLYLVSNAFEPSRAIPLLGMQKFLDADAALAPLRAPRPHGDAGAMLPGVFVAGNVSPSGMGTQSNTHGGFDNDPVTMNTVMGVILQGVPPRLFTARDLEF
ncbi:C1 family peptidase [Pseudoduganella sp. SL102]|uniref:C1 family peptidase n=1 Tax=Pseudoduganella sp. SL102 TaxID=2995154 RepID=UPI00248B00F7|nr:C1 family peptidase [Pseudoduganella sp. SL102]WBS04694.1 C1 family peptidase [Pseudoduganella sp. SL102]